LAEYIRLQSSFESRSGDRRYKRLIGDALRSREDAIMIYKVDRLTRSLADFAKIVDVAGCP
jgi:DNA invertase Pin-like site-specific DNA recombinase